MRASLQSAFFLLQIGLGTAALGADDPPKKIEGWGEVNDHFGTSKIELNQGTLIMTAPPEYVDNYIPQKITAPRVMQDVSGDFTVEVNVIHVDKAKPDSVLKSLGGFPTAYHSATLLVRHDDRNFIRYEQVSMNTAGNESTSCWLHVNRDGVRVSNPVESTKDAPIRLRLKRHGKDLTASFSQDDGKSWTKFPVQDIDFLPDDLKVGVSMTSNTDPPNTVIFQGLKVTKSKNPEKD